MLVGTFNGQGVEELSKSPKVLALLGKAVEKGCKLSEVFKNFNSCDISTLEESPNVLNLIEKNFKDDDFPTWIRGFHFNFALQALEKNDGVRELLIKASKKEERDILAIIRAMQATGTHDAGSGRVWVSSDMANQIRTLEAFPVLIAKLSADLDKNSEFSLAGYFRTHNSEAIEKQGAEYNDVLAAVRQPSVISVNPESSKLATRTKEPGGREWG